ncbi:MAG: DHH family phosphoesterase [Oscillospiraceae bacterium]|nr:DHH family phosphoesterase [Oscillospiraceae bacterium]
MNKKLGRLLHPGMGIYFVVMLGFCLAALLREHILLAAVEGCVTLVLYVFYILRRKHRHDQLQQYLQSIPGAIESVSRGESPFPTVMARLGDGGLIWANEQFASITGLSDSMMEHTLTDALPGFTTDWLVDRKTEAPYDITLDGRRYRVYGTSYRADDPAGTMIGVFYLSDLTMLYQVRDEYVRSRPVVSIILIDNYEELTKNLSESAISTLNAKLNDTITEWTDGHHGLLRKLERNRFLYIFEKRDLDSATEDKFSLLENIHQITSPSGLSASISIGLGVDGANFEESYNFAALSIEMALSRGGDQAVIKDRFNFTFYGGRNKEADYRSKVRSRVTANSLMELIGQSGHVFIMGHKNADLDSVGAAMGIACLCRKKNKKFNIVLDMENNASKQLLKEIVQVSEYREAFISGQEALLMCDNRSILIVVDTNRPDQVEFKPLLEAISKVCVVDHHRRAADYINPVVVNLHEPYASSASELTTELLQYAVEKDNILPIEAKSLLAGICLDTKFFNVRTGERTFEAAAALRRMGADTTEVKVLLQNDFQDTMAKYQIIKSARLYRQELAIAALNSATTRILAAQAADELLNISGITASFVLYPDGDTIIISARSIGSANVQMILEPLGGGGNTATAGAQVKNSTVKDTLDRLVASIDKFYEE